MSNQDKATARPWFITEDRLFCEPGDLIAFAAREDCEDSVLTDEQVMAELRRGVRAVNVHDELVQALDDLIRYADACAVDAGEPETPMSISAARAALAKARQ